ncbi:hypothetical protein RN001_002381 [Aquatica leii]|uniref:Major facilitator superfamily (MFS) profile domain-containing protein n=1 Tax=Aquatica leii TaxID=1421715 RepID=A0AAN7SSU0_9COLE|nr:hypothetical protein RN001_002381 [Aquatica leii]
MFLSFFLKKRYLYQYLIGFSGCISVLTSGINLSWTSPYLPKILNGTYTNLSMTNDEGSWCAVMPLVGAFPGAFLTIFIVDRIGRKISTLIMAPIALASFILLAFSNNVFLIFFVRFIIGAVEGGLYTVLPMYLGEISDPQIRGILTASMGTSSIAGALLINILGFHYSIFTSSLLCSIVPIVHFLTFIFVPESPYYLIKNNKIDDAKNSLKILRASINVDDELNELKLIVARQEFEEKPKMTNLFTVKSNRRALLIFIIINCTRKFCAKNPIQFYTSSIFHSAKGSISANSSVIVFLSIEFISAILGVFLLDKTGRRPLLIVSTTICAITLHLTGLHFIFQDTYPSYLSMFNWLPLTSLTIYNIFYTVGLELAQTVYLGELFPTNIKGKALGIAEMLSVINSTIVSKIFQILGDNFGLHYSFFFFSGCCVVGLLLVIKFVPETKNKTLEEIQLYLIHKTASKNPNNSS